MKAKIAIALCFFVLIGFSSAYAVGEKEQTSGTSTVESITVSQFDDDKVVWTASTPSERGYKIVWSKNSLPTYPTRSGDKYIYLSDPSANKATLHAFDGGGAYYVRVCEYLSGGTCGTYSNEISVNLVNSKIDSSCEENDGFKDVLEKHQNYDAILYLKEEGVIEGYSDGTFRPDKRINRAEFLKIAMEGSGRDLGGKNCFSDVAEQWFAQYVCSAKNQGIIDGYPDGTFKPSNDINFVEASKIIANTLHLNINDSYKDNWYHQFVKALEAKFAIPSSVDSFGKNITRGEMSEIIYRIVEEITDKKSLTYEYLVEKKILEEKNRVTYIHLKSLGGAKVGWTNDGYASRGFKVVWSKNSFPTYPTRSGDKYIYLSKPEASSTYLKAFDGGGYYFVRVCEYVSGGCNVYSNQIQVGLWK